MEELKLIMATIQTMGKDAQILAVIYFGYQLVKFVLGMGTVIFAIIVIAKIIKKAINDNSFGSQVGKLFGVDYNLYGSQKSEIIQWISKNNPPKVSRY